MNCADDRTRRSKAVLPCDPLATETLALQEGKASAHHTELPLILPDAIRGVAFAFASRKEASRGRFLFRGNFRQTNREKYQRNK